MRHLKIYGLISLVWIMTWAGSATAEVLELHSVGYRAPGVDYPSKGMSMTQVERQYGQPAEKSAAVGQPPISRWTYDGYTVYFEHSHVIHAVTHKPKHKR